MHNTNLMNGEKKNLTLSDSKVESSMLKMQPGCNNQTIQIF